MRVTCFHFSGFEHDSRSVKMIELEDKLCDKLRGKPLNLILYTGFIFCSIFKEHGTEYVAYLDSGYALGRFQ